MYRNYLTVGLCVLILAGCAANQRYQLSKDDKGRLLRLDTQTGQVMQIDGDQLTPVQGDTASEIKTNAQVPELTLPNGGKAWPAATLPELGNTSAALTSYWYNGKLHYVIELYPLSKRLKLVYSGYYSNPSFSLILNDKAGKRVAWTAIPANRLKHTFNKILKTEELSAEGVIVMTKQEYDGIDAWLLQWNPR